jgi:DNA mismatch endonuclease, patch repair protein
VVDHLTPEKRSWNMSRIKCKDTGPEMLVRSTLHRLGYRFSLHRKDLPGKPDIVLPKYKTIVFVHGCFWHQHKKCTRATIPSSNQDYWIPKLEKNKKRFKEAKKKLRKNGWKIVVIWECETKDVLKTTKIIKTRFEMINKKICL